MIKRIISFSVLLFFTGGSIWSDYEERKVEAETITKNATGGICYEINGK